MKFTRQSSGATTTVTAMSLLFSASRMAAAYSGSLPIRVSTSCRMRPSAAWITTTSAARHARTTSARVLARPKVALQLREDDDGVEGGKKKSKDQSTAAKSRMPFSSPRNSFDDSSPSSGGETAGLAWSKLGLTQTLVSLLTGPTHRGGLGFDEGPTPVQRMAIPAISSSSNVAFAAATGSGKTIAYLLPVIQSLKSQEDIAPTAEHLTQLRRPKRPRAIVLAPTRELALQIYTVIKSLSHVAKISSALLVGGEDMGKQRRRLENYPLDLLVATPGRLIKHWNTNVYLGSVRHLVIDEMDTMLEQGFQADIGQFLNALYRADNQSPQLILTTATMTNAVRRLLNCTDFPPLSPKKSFKKHLSLNEDEKPKILLPSDMRVLTAPGLHRAVPRLRQVFIDVGNTDKLSLLIDTASSSNDGLTLIFCNTVASCRAAQHALTEAGIDTLCYHGDMNSIERSANLKSFRSAAITNSNDKDDDDDELYAMTSQGNTNTVPRILVCTDIASRGLDVPEVNHVVMFDFPLNPIDYLHRAGRTARGGSGSSGRVTALVAKRDKTLAMAIEGAVQRGEPLDELSSRKSDYLPGGKLDGKTGTKAGSMKKPMRTEKKGNINSHYESRSVKNSRSKSVGSVRSNRGGDARFSNVGRVRSESGGDARSKRGENANSNSVGRARSERGGDTKSNVFGNARSTRGGDARSSSGGNARSKSVGSARSESGASAKFKSGTSARSKSVEGGRSKSTGGSKFKSTGGSRPKSVGGGRSKSVGGGRPKGSGDARSRFGETSKRRSAVESRGR